MAHINVKRTFRYENNVYELVSVGSYRLLSPCLENYTDVTDVTLIAALNKHTNSFIDS